MAHVVNVRDQFIIICATPNTHEDRPFATG
jgi:hypothetical protein